MAICGSPIKGLVHSGVGFLVTFLILNESRLEKTGLRGFRPGLTQTDLYSHRSRLEVSKKRNCTIRVAKTKAKLICAFVFA